MKTSIPLQLLSTLKRPGRSTCFLVKIVEVDGEASGYASVDFVVRFNDGLHDLIYDPGQELRPQNIQSTADLEVDNSELSGWFDDVVEKKVLAGKLDSAEVTVYRVAYLKLQAGAEVVAFGRVGRIDYSAGKSGKRKIEFRSLTAQLKSKMNDVYSLTCRLDFGSPECGKPFIWHAGTVGAVEDNFLRFQITGVAQPDGYFNLGLVMFDSGDNAGYSMEVESWTADGWVTLSFVTPFEVETGTSVRIRQDCGKTETDCKGYGNIVNMQAEHLTPVQDQALMVPGAYIKSNNAL